MEEIQNMREGGHGASMTSLGKSPALQCVHQSEVSELHLGFLN